MLSWSASKKLLYLSLTIAVLGIVVGIPLYFKITKKPPTCFDGILNQDEVNIDCGGVCPKLCPGEAVRPEVVFNRYFRVAEGVYSAVALIENRNQNLYALRVPYIFKFYDKDGVLLTEREGETFMTGSKTFPVVEYTIPTNQREVVRMTFELLGEIKWQRGSFKDPKVEVVNKTLKDEESFPRLTASVRNNEIYRIEDIPVVAMLYDKNNNLMAASHTMIDEIAGRGEEVVVFTWNRPFADTPTKIDIIPRLLPRELSR